MRSAVCAAFVVLCATACGSSGGGVRGDVLLTAARMFDGRRMVEPAAVLVRGSTIVSVGKTLHAHAGRKIDLGDATILPGFIDLHVHGETGTMVRHGVTTVRNVGAPLLYLRPPYRSHGLRVLMAGPLLTVPGGYPTPVWGPHQSLDVRGQADARRAVRILARRGAAVIKIALETLLGPWPTLDVGAVRAIVGEAHEQRLQVTAHAFGSRAVALALAGGVDELAHNPCGATTAMIRNLVARRVPVVATMHVEERMGGCRDVARRFHRLGGRLLYGTDYGNQGIPAGIDVEELKDMHGIGMTPAEVLEAATSQAGEEAGLAPLGTLAPGAPADVIAVRGDARTLGENLASPLAVVSGGRVIVDRGRANEH